MASAQEDPAQQPPSPLTAANELTRRGLDSASLIRYGMWRQISASVVGEIIAGRVFPILNSPENKQSKIDNESWATALKIPNTPSNWQGGATPFAEVEDYIAKIVDKSFPAVTRWIKSAPIHDIIELNPPSQIHPKTGWNEDIPDEEICNQYSWAVDRFSETFPRDWKESSLHLEYLWQAGEISPPCPESLMGERTVSQEILNAEIARRTVRSAPQKDNSRTASVFRVSDMTRYARTLLKNNRNIEAASIFEFASKQNPSDPEAHNNLGFCLIPTDPQKALQHLEIASDLNYEVPATNTYNKACCYIALGRPRSALNCIEQFWPHIIESDPREASLWRVNSENEWELFESNDSTTSLIDLAIDVSSSEGWLEDVHHWKYRKSSI
ncbi:tetratricopeptide repeat protein [Nocardiopsis sp. M1B1]|uniref:tetratricopeptide repeat protein n=1 Tax=Nocardiopsis sp. M1B1 TaxID=3450454 RepID=UPI004039422F